MFCTMSLSIGFLSLFISSAMSAVGCSSPWECVSCIGGAWVNRSSASCPYKGASTAASAARTRLKSLPSFPGQNPPANDRCPCVHCRPPIRPGVSSKGINRLLPLSTRNLRT
eukprot:GHVT01032119.1.p1 GENE.GHVT01032119.1~~GHVT01032119.1.p1  ORF type:complete len:112 (-),score=1.68 GHVT01032119.1:358-693(-)